MNMMPKVGDLLYAESGKLIARHLEVVAVEVNNHISDSIITVLGKYRRKYKEPLWIFCGIE